MKIALLEQRGKMGKAIKSVFEFERANWEEVKCVRVPITAIQKILAVSRVDK